MYSSDLSATYHTIRGDAMQHSISRLIASPWIGYIYRGLLALVVAVALAATPSASPTDSPPSNGNQSTQNGDHEVTPLVNWNK
jgi:hypothetical protein